MSGPDKERGKGASKRGAKPARVPQDRPPDWTSGLKRLYDSVVEEPLPDCLKDLLSRLDDSET